MSVQELPLRSDFKAYDFQIDLDGQTYTLRFRLNDRMGRWIMDISDASGTDILTGVVVLTNIPLTDQYKALANMPPGRFFAIDETGENKDPGTDDIGNDVKVVYEEAST